MAATTIVKEGPGVRVAGHDALHTDGLTEETVTRARTARTDETIARDRTLELVDLARAGDADAWESLYRGVYPRLWAYLARRVGPENADDAVSETMIRAVVGLRDMTLGAPGFDGWAFGIARRVAADHHRGADRRRRREQVAPVLGGRLEVFDSAADDLVAADDRAELRRAFERLSQSDQELLELRVVAGLSAEAAALVLRRRPGAVRTAQSRALQRLRYLLGDGDD